MDHSKEYTCRVGISAAYVFLMRDEREKSLVQDDHASDAQWANEGGANAPASV
jgi:hypothetical protein